MTHFGVFSTVFFFSSSLLILGAWKLITKTELLTTPTVYLNLSEQSRAATPPTSEEILLFFFGSACMQKPQSGNCLMALFIKPRTTKHDLCIQQGYWLTV